MNIAILHPQCRVRGGAIKMALLTAQSLKQQGHKVMFYTFDHDSACFPELQDGLTIITSKTTKTSKTEKRETDQPNIAKKVDNADKRLTFWGFFGTNFPRFSSIIGIAWDIRQVDIVIAHNPPMQIVGALGKIFSFFSGYHQLLTLIWWHHHIPWYYRPKPKNRKDTIFAVFSVIYWKSFFERHMILPRVKHLVATSYYTAFCLEKYCGRKSIVIHPVITTSESQPVNHHTDSTLPVILFTHGRLEPGKGLDRLVSIWKELNNTNIQLLIAGEGSLKNWLIEQGAKVIPYYDGILEEIQKTKNDILAIYLSTIDAFGMASLEAQIAGLSTIILDRGGARETVLLDSSGHPMAQLVDSDNEIMPAITYFIQQRQLHKRVSNVNFCHQREYFSPSRLDADIRSLIEFVR